MISRFWHLVPIAVAGTLAAFFWKWFNTQFYSSAKLTFETSASLVGLVGTAATFIEVWRAVSSNKELQANIGVALDRKRVSDMKQLAQQVKDAILLLDGKNEISGKTASDITASLRAIYPDGGVIGEKPLAEVEDRVLNLPRLKSVNDRHEALAALGAIRSHVEAEISRINKALDSLPLRKN